MKARLDFGSLEEEIVICIGRWSSDRRRRLVIRVLVTEQGIPIVSLLCIMNSEKSCYNQAGLDGQLIRGHVPGSHTCYSNLPSSYQVQKMFFDSIFSAADSAILQGRFRIDRETGHSEQK
jgi:hypothetical protein